jgi:hypothetical protein
LKQNTEAAAIAQKADAEAAEARINAKNLADQKKAEADAAANKVKAEIDAQRVKTVADANAKAAQAKSTTGTGVDPNPGNQRRAPNADYLEVNQTLADRAAADKRNDQITAEQGPLQPVQGPFPSVVEQTTAEQAREVQEAKAKEMAAAPRVGKETGAKLTNDK